MYWMARKKKGETVENEQESQKQLVVLGGDPHCHDVGGSGVEVEENKIFFYCGVGSKEVLELNRAIMRLDSDMQIVGLKLGIQPPRLNFTFTAMAVLLSQVWLRWTQFCVLKRLSILILMVLPLVQQL